MGLSFAEYAALTPYLFIEKIKGYKSAKRKSDLNYRNVAYILSLPNAKKGLKPEMLWGIDGDTTIAVVYKNKRQMNKILKEYFKNKQERLNKLKYA